MKKSYYSLLLLILIINVSDAFAQTSWKGTSNSSWSSKNNWTNDVPSSTVDAILGDANFTGSYQPSANDSSSCKSITIGGRVATTLTVSQDFEMSGNVTINANGTLLHTNKTITLTGNWSNSGNYTASGSGSSVVFAGTAQTIGGSVSSSFIKLTINAANIVTLNSNISVSSSLIVSGILNTNESPTYIVSGTGTYTVNSGGTLKVNASTFGGNYSLSGTATISEGSIIEYSATATSQTVSNSITYSTLIISGSRTKSLSGNLPSLISSASTYGNIYITGGTFDLGPYTVNRGTTATGGLFSAASGTTLKIGGTNSFPSNYNTISLNSNSTVDYTGTTQTIPAGTYSNLIISTSGTKTAGGNIIVLKNFNLSNGIFIGGNYTHNIGGDWTMTSGTFTNTGNTIVLNGGTTQTINSTGNFNNLTINNSSSVNLGSNIIVNGAVTFTSGKIALASYNLTLGSSAAISGASTSKYIIATGAGTLVQQVIKNTAKVFPIGTAGAYLPATISLTLGSTTDNFSARLVNEMRTTGTTGNLFNSNVVNATWFISEETIGGSNATLTLQWPGSFELSGFSHSSCRLAHYTNGRWDYGTSSLTPSGSNPYTVSRSGFTSFSPFGLGNVDALPVTWVKVFGEHIKDDNNIQWTTVNEINNEYFAIESATDGKNFNEIGRIDGSGNSSGTHNYSFIHKQAYEALYYYRIKQVDYNGREDYSKVIKIMQSQGPIINNVILYPNPVNDIAALSVSLNENSDISIIVNDANGKVVYMKNTNLTKGNNLLSVDMGIYPAGIYFLHITNDSGVSHTTEFIKN